jgi:hypothetical protein
MQEQLLVTQTLSGYYRTLRLQGLTSTQQRRRGEPPSSPLFNLN